MTMEDKLRDALDQRASAISPDERAAWARLHEELSRNRRPRYGIVAAIAAALVVVITVPLLLLTQDDDNGISTRRRPTAPAGVPSTWTRISDPQDDLAVWVPADWARLDPAANASSNIERLAVGTAPREAEFIFACSDPSGKTPGSGSTTTPSSYISIWESPDGAALALPGGGTTAGPFRDRSTLEPTLADAGAGAGCHPDGTTSTDLAAAENRFSTISFSDDGRRFYARVVVIGDSGGRRFAEAAQVLQSLEVAPLTAPSTEATTTVPVETEADVQELAIRGLPTLTFDAAEYTVTSGDVEITLASEGGTHTLAFDDRRLDSFLLTATAEQPQSATVHLDPGTYVIYCTLPGHREAGSESHIVVT